MAEPFLGEIRIMAFGFAPRGWAQCNGQFLPINQNQALFSLLGTQFGGNGQTTFALPNMRGRTPIHAGGSFSLATSGGEAVHTISSSEMPQHAHVLSGTSNQAPADVGNIPGPNGTKLLAASIGDSMYKAPAALVAMGAGMLASVGGSQPHNNMMPYLTVNFCIALIGIFPSVN